MSSKAKALSLHPKDMSSHPKGLSPHPRGLSSHPRGLSLHARGLSPLVCNAAPLASHWLLPEWNKPVTTKGKLVGAKAKVETERGKGVATNIKRVSSIYIYLIADAWVQ